MSQEIEDLIRKLTPIKGREWADQRLREYADSKFSPTLKKAIEQEVKNQANHYNLQDQTILYPLPKRSNVSGEYKLGQAHYGNLPLNASFGLRDSDWIKHVGIFGATGSGKTNTASVLIKQLCEQKKPFLILDPKGTWQGIIRQPYARDVKILQLGSAHAPYTFDPFKPLPGMDMDTLVSDVVETICDSQYLGFGAKDLLLRAVQNARKNNNLSIRGVFDEFKQLPVRGAKEKSWYSSTLRALRSATSGILGKVLSHQDNIPFEKLMDSQVVVLLDLLVDSDQVSMFNGLMLNRIYWFRKLQGIREQFKHLLVLEEFHIMSKAELVRGESRIDKLIKLCREFSQGVMVIEQNPGDVSQHVIGNLNTIVSMNLGHSKDIFAAGTAMVLDGDERKYLGKLSTGWAICRIKDRFPEKILVKVDYERQQKREITPEEIKNHNGEFATIKPAPIKELVGDDKLDLEYLEFMKFRDGSNLRDVYNRMAMSYRRGNSFRKYLEGQGYLYSQKIATKTGKEIRLYLTPKGRRALGLKDKRRLGGPWHRLAVEQISGFYRSQDFIVRIEYQDIDVFVDKGTEAVAVEVESLGSTADYLSAVANIMKASRLADRVEVVVKDNLRANKLQQYVWESPLRNYRGLSIKLLEEFAKISK